MTRFGKLEFDESEDADRPQTSGQSSAERVDKDEHYWFNLADSNRRNGQYENALRFFSRSLELNKTLVEAWTGQVQMLIQLGEYPQASLWSQKALELFPNHGELLAGRAQAECRLGNQRDAVGLSDRAMSQRGDTAYQWQVRGELMVVMKQRTDRHCFDKAQVLSRDFIVPLETGMIYMHYRHYAKAQQRIQMAIEKQPESAHAWYLLGICQQQSGFSDTAIRSFERCRELHPNHHEAGVKLAELRDSSWSIGRIFRRLIKRS